MEPVNVSVLEEEEHQRFPGQVQEQKTFESHNYYDVYMHLREEHEKLLNERNALQREKEELQKIVDRAAKVLDGFTERVITIPTFKMKAFVSLSTDEEFYMAIDSHDSIKWMKNEKEYQKYCAQSDQIHRTDETDREL